MRGWKVTAGLAVAALLAAFVAPRLIASFESAAVVEPPPTIAPVTPPAIVDVPASPMVTPVRRAVDVVDVRPAPVLPPARDVGRQMRRAARPSGAIPEIDAVPHFEPRPTGLPVPVQPIEPDNWPDMVDCGMG